MSKKPDGKRKEKPAVSHDEFKAWLAALNPEAKPTLHVNGPQFSNAVLTVDFGKPTKGTKLTAEQAAELARRMIAATRKVCRLPEPAEGARNNVRINNDRDEGVYWTSV